MRWVSRLIATDDAIRPESADLIEIYRPAGIATIADLGLTLTEAKQLLRCVQQAVVAAQTAAARSAAKLTKALIALETCVSGLADLIIDYASARLDDEPFFTSPTEGAVQWLLHRRMGAQQQMRWSPRGAHLMLQVRTAIVNGTLDEDHRDICRHRRSFRIAA